MSESFSSPITSTNVAPFQTQVPESRTLNDDTSPDFSALAKPASPPRFAFDSSFKCIRPDENLLDALSDNNRRSALISELTPAFVMPEVARRTKQVGPHIADIIYSSGLCALDSLLRSWDASVPLEAYLNLYYKGRVRDDLLAYDRNNRHFHARAKISAATDYIKRALPDLPFEEIQLHVAERLNISQKCLTGKIEKIKLRTPRNIEELETSSMMEIKRIVSRPSQLVPNNKDPSLCGPDVKIIGREESRLLNESISFVPGLTGVIARLRFQTRFSADEISSLVGITPTCVYQYIKRAINFLKQNFNSETLQPRKGGQNHSSEDSLSVRKKDFGIPDSSAGFFVLLHRLRTGEIHTSWSTVCSFADHPDFYTLFLTSRDPHIKGVRDILLSKPLPNLATLDANSRASLQEYFQFVAPDLDSFSVNLPLSRILGCEYHQERAAARRLLEIGALDAEPSIRHPLIFSNGMKTRYITPEVVGEEMASANRIQLLKQHFPTLDHLNAESAPPSIRAIITGNSSASLADCARALIEQKIVSARVPRRHTPMTFHGHEGSYYFDREVVGKLALLNLKRYLRESFKTLDDIPPSTVFAEVLGCGKYEIPKTVVALGWYSSEIPTDHPMSYAENHKLTRYMQEEVVGAEQVIRNARRFMQYTFTHLDKIEQKHGVTYKLQEIFGLAAGSTTELAAYAAKHGVLPWEMDPSLPLMVGTRLSFFLDIDVLPRALIRQNLKSWVDRNLRKPADVKRSKALVRALNNSRTEREPELDIRSGRPVILQALAARKWI